MFSGSTNNSQMYVNIYSPNIAKNTTIDWTANNIGAAEYHWRAGGYLADNTQYTGFTLTADTGTLSGTVSVYGYNK